MGLVETWSGSGRSGLVVPLDRASRPARMQWPPRISGSRRRCRRSATCVVPSNSPATYGTRSRAINSSATPRLVMSSDMRLLVFFFYLPSSSRRGLTRALARHRAPGRRGAPEPNTCRRTCPPARRKLPASPSMAMGPVQRGVA